MIPIRVKPLWREKAVGIIDHPPAFRPPARN
jgi:hypothetical protein